MRFQITFFILILIFTIFLTGCPSAETPNANANSPANANAPKSTNSELTPTKKVEAPTENNAPTITPVVMAYYDALKKKDDAAFRKVLSEKLIKEWEADMKAEGKKSLVAFIAETDKIPDKPVEVRNEKVDGDKAIAQIKGGTYVNWTDFEFVKIDGVWKWNGSPEVKKVTESVSNTAK